MSHRTASHLRSLAVLTRCESVVTKGAVTGEVPKSAAAISSDGLETTFTPSKLRNGSSSGGRSYDKSMPVLHVGRVLADRWEVGDRIGMGGMASVHTGIDLRLGRKVAIKILHPHVAENPEARARLAREARAIAQLKHENVIEVYDYSSDDPECTWLVTELVEGSTLRALIEKRGKIMPEIAAMISSEILRALRAAHAVGVIHRDVKPDNVLIGKDGRPKLSDFGIAQIVDEQRMTVTGNLVGSPSYMSPEQAEGRRTDSRTDLFSAGIVLYRMVCGALPFSGQNAIETLRKVAAVTYTDPMEIAPDCPGSVAAVIRRALSPEMLTRYQTADEMLGEVMAIVDQAGFRIPYEELERYFADPEDYEAVVGPKIGRALFVKAKLLLQNGQEAQALDLFTRARALGVSDEQSLDLVRVLSDRRERRRARRSVWAASLAAVLVGIVGGGFFASGSWGSFLGGEPSPRAPQPATEPVAAPPPAPAPAALERPAPAEPPPIAEEPKREPAREEDDALARRAAKKKKREEPAKPAVPAPERPAPQPVAAKPEPPPPPPPAAVEQKRGVLQIGASRWVDIYVNGVKLGRAPDQSKYSLPAGAHKLRAVNPHCKPVERDVAIEADQTTRVRLDIDCG
jgi:eukaryotic-like serine/threonine-protein kinase